MLLMVIILAVPAFPQPRQKQDQLGQVCTRQAAIRTTPRQTGRVLSYAARDTWVVIIGAKGSYYVVRLDNGAKGYILKPKVRLLDYRNIKGDFGRIGQVQTRQAIIHASPTQASRILSHASRDTFVSIAGDKDSYYAVWMADGSKGYILRRDVRLVDYEVVQPK